MQIRNLTGIRGIAALWVALYHFQSTAVVATLPLGPIIGGGAVGVDIFFVLSAFILSLTYAARFARSNDVVQIYRDFLTRRFARIYPLHLVTLALMLIFWGAAARTGYAFQGTVQNSGFSVICNLLMVHAWGVLRALSWNAPSWSVSAEWLAYVALFPFCVRFLQRWSITRIATLTVLLWCAFVGYVVAAHQGRLAEVNTDGALRIIPEFIGGYLLYRDINENPLRWRAEPVMTAALAGFACVLLLPGTLMLLLPAVLLLIGGLYRGSAWVDRVFGNPLIVWLGEISYSIYMLHAFVLIVANQIIRRLHVAPSSSHALAVLALECIGAVVAGALGYRFIECPARAQLTNILLVRRKDASHQAHVPTTLRPETVDVTQ